MLLFLIVVVLVYFCCLAGSDESTSTFLGMFFVKNFDELLFIRGEGEALPLPSDSDESLR